MKRNLNTCYRLVWNDTLKTYVVVSELAKARGKRLGTLLAVSLAGLISGTALAANSTVPVGETVEDAVINNHDEQRVWGTTNNTIINTGLELGSDSEKNTGGQQILSGGVANHTIVNRNGLQIVQSGGKANETQVNSGGGQSVKGQTSGTVLNGGEQYVHAGGVATGTVINQGGYQTIKVGAQAFDTVVNTGAQGGPDAENHDGMFVSGKAVNTQINAQGRQIIGVSGMSTGTTIYEGGDQSVHGQAKNTVLNGGFQYVHSGAAATDTVINGGGWQVMKDGATADNTTVNNGGKLSVAAGGRATNSIINAGGALVSSTAADVSGTNRLGNFVIDSATGHASGVVLENGGRLDVLSGDSADTTTVDKAGTLAVATGGVATHVTLHSGSALIADSGSTVSGTNAQGAFTIDAASGKSQGLLLENGGHFSVKSGGVAENTTIGSGGVLSVVNGGRLSGVTSLAEKSSLTIAGDVISTGTLENAGTITFASAQSDTATPQLFVVGADKGFTPRTLTTTNLMGQGGTINMTIRLDKPGSTDRLVIDGGTATGKTWLNFTNVGNAGLGLATTGDGIKVVDALNGATTEAGAFALANKLQAGAYNYTLSHGSLDENWYLTSEAGYRAEVALYASLFAQSLDYDRILAGSYDQRRQAQKDRSVWGRIQGGHLSHSDNGGVSAGATPESRGNYGLVQLGSDLLQTEVGTVSLTAGVYAALGHTAMTVKDDDRSRAGTARDDIYSVGGYLTARHAPSGLWSDMVLQGARHRLGTASDDNHLTTQGTGWLASLESGLPLALTSHLILEPQLQYTWQGISLNNGADSGGHVNFTPGQVQSLRAGLRLGSPAAHDNQSVSAEYRDSIRTANWWIRPSVLRTVGSRGDLTMGTEIVGSDVSITPSQVGTAFDLQAGVTTQLQPNITLGVQGGYTHSLSENSVEGYNSQVSLNIAF
ncbi:autotransporter adhesin family protein [Edwardsiella tarda]|uniref:AIDA repeat-containing protein n=1 Tax=Edwardsiella tarda TaxID=636 RepID=UPI00351C92F2